MASISGSAGKAREEPEGMEAEAQLLRELAEIPAHSAAWVGQTNSIGNCITVQYAQRDLANNKLRKYLRTFQLPTELAHSPIEAKPSFPIELRDVVLHSVSPSGNRQLVVRASKEGDSMVLELWAGSRVVKELHVPKDLHGKIYNDNWFGTGAAWSRDENRIAYVAESALSTKTPDWGQGSQPTEKNKAGSAKPDAAASDCEAAPPPKAAPKSWRGVGEFQEDWGELNTGKKVPKLFTLDFGSGSVDTVRGLPEECSCGQPIWTPDGSGLVFVAWPHKALNFPGLPQRLGVVYCVNRPCFLYHIRLPSTAPSDRTSSAETEDAQKIETSLQSGLCPQFSPDGKNLVFMSHNAAVTSGAHCASVTLESVPWPSTGPQRTLVGLVANPETENSFPGLHSFLLSRVPFAFIDNNRLLVTTHWRSFLRIVEVSIPRGDGPASIEPASPIDPPAPCWILLAAEHGVAVASKSGPRQASTLAVAKLGSSKLQWHDIETGEEQFSTVVNGFFASQKEAYHVIQVKPTIGPKNVPCEAVLLLSKAGNKEKASTIVFIHGGPHTAFAAAYVLSNAFLNLIGYNVLQVNYRGSLGFGEDSVQSLPGNAGVHDVADCLACLDTAIHEGWVDADKVGVVGGSHGGFLTGHLVGQQPGRFKAAVLRNPVMDLGLMTQISDIPDWCFVEAFGGKEGQKRASPKPGIEELKQLTEKSPIRYVDKVTAPLLFLLGAKDRRVNMRDAHQYVAALRAQANSPEARVIVFPEDTHALEQPQTEFEQWLNAAWWLQRFM